MLNRPAICQLILCCIVSSCAAAAPDWRHDEPGEAHELAQVICDEVRALEADPARVRTLAAMLGDRQVVYTGDELDGTRIVVTVRDVAFTVLEEAGVIHDRVDRKLKLLHGCQAGDEWMRIHIPVLDDEDFEAARRQLSE